MAAITDVAESVVAELDAATLSQSFDASRTYLPAFELNDLQDLRVTVVPRSVEMTPGGRDQNQHDYAVDVAVQKKLTSCDNTEIDGLVELVGEIADLFRFRRLSSYPDAMWLRTENVPVYSLEHLEQFRQFTSVLTFTFRIMR